MVAPLAARCVAAAFGAALVITAWTSAIGTLIVPRQVGSWMTLAFVGFTLLLWPWATSGITSAFSDAGSSMFTLGYREPGGPWPAVVIFAAATGLVIVALPC